MKGWGDSASAICVAKILETISSNTLELFTFNTCFFFKLSSVNYGLVVLCLLLWLFWVYFCNLICSFVHAVLRVYCCFYFRCRTAVEVHIRKVLQPAT